MEPSKHVLKSLKPRVKTSHYSLKFSGVFCHNKDKLSITSISVYICSFESLYYDGGLKNSVTQKTLTSKTAPEQVGGQTLWGSCTAMKKSNRGISTEDALRTGQMMGSVRDSLGGSVKYDEESPLKTRLHCCIPESCNQQLCKIFHDTHLRREKREHKNLPLSRHR